MEVIESSKNLELLISHPDGKTTIMEEEDLEKIVKEIEKEREEQ